ncbi:MAG: PKD domain-containing protein [Thermoplasmata archaeon]|nr:PKD domain-containing protein [Thermoplasmata archaeon]
MRRPPRRDLLPIATAALLLLVGLVPLASSGSPGTDRTGSPIPQSEERAPGSAPVPSGGSSLACLGVPRAVPCLPGPDQAVVDLVSNSSDSGARFSLGVSLPGNGSDPESVLGAFWVGLWVTGAPCSIDGASYLTVNLYPPYSPAVVPVSPDWVAQVPVLDLAPAGSCDPLCQNASASGEVGGVPVCADNLIVGGGWARSSSVGRFAPGDQLTITAWGTANSTGPLGVWVNDTTDPAESSEWRYYGSATVTGDPVAPRYGSSNASDPGWSTPFDAAFGWTDCPSSAGPTACNTYDSRSLEAAGVPLVTFATYWNASTGTVESFPWIATASSSGACSGAVGLAPCPDARSFGGSGSYPNLAIVPNGPSGAAWRLGSPSGALLTYGSGPSAGFLSNGSATWQSPAATTVDSAVGIAGNATINLTVADPRGASSLEFEALWCSPSGPTLTDVVTPASGTLVNVSTTLTLAPDNGTLTYWVAERSDGSVWGVPVAHSLSMTHGSGSCTLPAPSAPALGASNVTPVAGGYRLNWSEPSPDIRGFEVAVNSTSSSFEESSFVGNVTATTVTGLPTPGTYLVAVTALTFANTSAGTTVTPTSDPLASFAVVASLAAGPYWHGSSSAPVNVTIVGGASPFGVRVTLGNGSVTEVSSPTNSTNVAVALADGLGLVSVSVTVDDANGVTAVAPPLLRDVWGGPLAPVANASAGGSSLAVNWSVSASPTAPVTGYTVYLTSNVSLSSAPFRMGPANTSSNVSDGGVLVWNTTNDTASLPWADNSTAYATVVPFDSLGFGFATASPVEATPAPLSPGPIQGGPGGPAPYSTTLSTVLSTGTNDTIDEAIYSYPGFAFTPANLTRTSPTQVYVNATVRITTLGLAEVLLHVSDTFGGTAIATTDVLVTDGAPPQVTAQTNPSPAYVGVAVNFTASATGTGPFVYTWAFGDGTNGSGATVDHAFSRAGTFTASVTVVDNGTGGSATADVAEVVYALPSVAITTDAGPDGTGSYAFHARLIGGSGTGSFLWAFGDGAVGQGENVTHDYHSDGTFVVNVTATDASLRTAYANVTVYVGTLGATSSTGSTLGEFTPLAAGILVTALAGWGVAIIALIRLRRGPERDPDERPPLGEDEYE